MSKPGWKGGGSTELRPSRKLSQSRQNADLLLQDHCLSGLLPMAQGLPADRLQHADHMGQVSFPVEKLGRKHRKDRQ